MKKEKLKLLRPNAAGIDVASEVHYVAVPPDCCKNPVRSFGSFTDEIHSMAKWLKECNIKTVAMESCKQKNRVNTFQKNKGNTFDKFSVDLEISKIN